LLSVTARSQGLLPSCGAQSSSAEAALTRQVRRGSLEQCIENRSRFCCDLGVEVGILDERAEDGAHRRLRFSGHRGAGLVEAGKFAAQERVGAKRLLCRRHR